MMMMMGREEEVGWRGEMEWMRERKTKKWDVILVFSFFFPSREEKKKKKNRSCSKAIIIDISVQESKQDKSPSLVKKYYLGKKGSKFGQLTNRRAVTTLDEKKKKKKKEI